MIQSAGRSYSKKSRPSRHSHQVDVIAVPLQRGEERAVASAGIEQAPTRCEAVDDAARADSGGVMIKSCAGELAAGDSMRFRAAFRLQLTR